MGFWGSAFSAHVRVQILCVALVSGLLAFPSLATADPPAIVANPLGSLNPTTMRFSVSLSNAFSTPPPLPVTQAELQYSTAADEWCTSAGASGTPTVVAITADVRFPTIVSASGLTTGVAYCARLSVSNADGTTNSGFYSFSAGAPLAGFAPVVNEPSIKNLSAATTTIAARINPISQATDYWIRYWSPPDTCFTNDPINDPYDSTGKTESAHTALTGALDNVYHSVPVQLTGLTPGQSYCATVFATNAGGDMFPASVQPFVAGTPNVQSGLPSVQGTTIAVPGSVNPAAQPTEYWVEYSTQPAGPDGCAADASTPHVALGAADTAMHQVQVLVSGLAPHTDYCFALRAGNASGLSSKSSGFRLTTGEGSGPAPQLPASTDTTPFVSLAVPAAPGPVASISKLASTRSANGKTVRVGAVSCASAGACTVSIRAKAKLTKKGKSKAVGSGRLTVAAGRSATPSISLTSAARKALKRGGKLKLAVTVTVIGPAGPVATSAYALTAKRR